MQPYSVQTLLAQARRTESTRQFLYEQAGAQAGAVALDLGCGPGTITEELSRSIPHAVAVGLDIDVALLDAGVRSYGQQGRLHFLLADATLLPLRSSCMELVLSHFTLMWIRDWDQALSEIHRVLRHQGAMAAIEPDYGGRLEGPAATHATTVSSPPPIVKWLLDAGANPCTGSQLPAALRRIGLKAIRFGILAWEHNSQMARAEIRGEAALLEAYGIHWSAPDFSFTPIFWLLARKL